MDTVQQELTAYYDQIASFIIAYGFSILGAGLILIAGLWAAGFTQRHLVRALDRTGKIDPTISLFLGSAAKYLIIVFSIIAVLEQFGVETTSLVALLGAAGLAIGLAMQGTLSSVAAGVMLLIFRPFRVGQFIEAGGVSGTVESITLFTTHLNTGDNVHIVVPNAEIWGAPITNFSHNPTRRIELVVGIGYDDEIHRAISTVEDVLAADPRALAEPTPVIEVSNLGASSVDILIRVWCKSEDYWALKWALTRAIKEAFDRAAISIPYPHRVVQTISK